MSVTLTDVTVGAPTALDTVQPFKARKNCRLWRPAVKCLVIPITAFAFGGFVAFNLSKPHWFYFTVNLFDWIVFIQDYHRSDRQNC